MVTGQNATLALFHPSYQYMIKEENKQIVHAQI